MTEEELIELLMAFVPESFEGWLAYVIPISAILSYILPAPPENAHPVVKAGHKMLFILGIGASKIRAAGKVAKALHGKKEEG